MKRVLLILLIFANNTMLFAQLSISELYKQWMIEDINHKKFNKAAEEMSHVDDWTFDVSNQSHYIDIGSAVNFLTYVDSININTSVVDSLKIYIARVSQTYGVYYYYQSDYAKAEEYYLEVVRLYKSTLGENHPYYAESLCALGALYCDIGDYAQAEEYYLEALRIRKSVLGENHPDYASSIHELGILYHHMGDYAKAEEYYLEVVRLYKSTLGENHYNYAASLNNLGTMYTRMGDYGKAKAYCLEALQLYKSIVGENHPAYAISLSGIGKLYCHLGDYAQAEKYCLEALRIRKFELGENHPEYASSISDLGVLYCYMGNFAKAEEYMAQAMHCKKKLFMQASEYMTEQQRNLFFETLHPYFAHVHPLFAFNYYIEKPSVSIFIYENELFAKGLLLDTSESVKFSIYASGDTVLINKWNQLITEKQLIMSIQEEDPQSPYIAEHQERAEQLEKEITKSSAAYRENQAMWQITWDSVRNHLSSNQIAIEYMVAPLNEDSTMYCALLLRDTCSYPIMIPLFNEPEVSSLINTSTENQTSFTYSYDGNGEQLFQLVWNKILPYIKKGETIYFAPSGLLHQLAIESLPYDSTYTMADMFNLVRLSSTREIVTRKNETQHSSAALYGGIQYDVNTDEILAESEKYSANDLLASRGIESDTINRGSIKYLKGTKTEVETINSMLKQNNLQVQLFTSINANEESFKALSGKHQNILHIATHGFFWTDSTAQKKEYFSQRMLTLGNDMPSPPAIDPLNRCGLLFAGAQTAWSGHSTDLPEGVQDGILTAKEISLLDLRDADLVVLSACETGKGEITGDGVFGLQRAFKQAGAQTIIMSLWPVNDAATQLLMTEFYRNWITKHQSKREAFRNAQNTVRSKYEEPVYWAGFIMLD